MLLGVLQLPLDNARSGPEMSVCIRLPRSLRLLGPFAPTLNGPKSLGSSQPLALLLLFFCFFPDDQATGWDSGCCHCTYPGAGLPLQEVASVQLLCSETPGSHACRNRLQVVGSREGRDRLPWSFHAWPLCPLALCSKGRGLCLFCSPKGPAPRTMPGTE